MEAFFFENVLLSEYTDFNWGSLGSSDYGQQNAEYHWSVKLGQCLLLSIRDNNKTNVLVARIVVSFKKLRKNECNVR